MKIALVLLPFLLASIIECQGLLSLVSYNQDNKWRFCVSGFVCLLFQVLFLFSLSILINASWLIPRKKHKKAKTSDNRCEGKQWRHGKWWWGRWDYLIVATIIVRFYKNSDVRLAYTQTRAVNWEPRTSNSPQYIYQWYLAPQIVTKQPT